MLVFWTMSCDLSQEAHFSRLYPESKFFSYGLRLMTVGVWPIRGQRSEYPVTISLSSSPTPNLCNDRYEKTTASTITTEYKILPPQRNYRRTVDGWMDTPTPSVTMTTSASPSFGTAVNNVSGNKQT
ncbi:unnamed protein product [Soboliphyme baturini]|uniref:Uncharacterized protein n=1 Tax=Soboliphyme baturini TaxID=241478 RepID=A0A183IDJ5_9BILA|nr:unnamed protein product [Soboliphyme baturini]